MQSSCNPLSIFWKCRIKQIVPDIIILPSYSAVGVLWAFHKSHPVITCVKKKSIRLWDLSNHAVKSYTSNKVHSPFKLLKSRCIHLQSVTCLWSCLTYSASLLLVRIPCVALYTCFRSPPANQRGVYLLVQKLPLWTYCSKR